MTIDDIIQGLQFTIEMFYFDPSSGKKIDSPRNDLDAITINSCKAAINVLNKLKLWEEFFIELT